MAKKNQPSKSIPEGARSLDFSRSSASPLDVARAQAIGILNNHGIRELVESIVIAFVLAFLFKTFLVEAFVIPTGSMAPTLQGRHKDIDCPICDYQFQSSASEEIIQATNAQDGEVIAATCPMCRYRTALNVVMGEELDQFDIDAFNSNQFGSATVIDMVQEDALVSVPAIDQKSYSGDRILVNKFAYELDTPQRWDVIVFRFPEKSTTNYIKRLIGLPGETLEIYRGDIFTKPNEGVGGIDPGTTPMGIARKPPRKIKPMSQIVYDNNYVVNAMTARGWPTRWQSWPSSTDTAAWASKDGTRSFQISGEAENATAWIRYQHFPPSFGAWEDLLDPEVTIDTSKVRPQLITDTYQYNSSGRVKRKTGYSGPEPTWQGIHWVGDLLLEANLEVRSSKGKILLDLVEGGFHFTCTIDIATGGAELKIANPTSDDTYAFQDAEGHRIETPTAQTPITSAGNYAVAFANVDDELVLWVDGDPIRFAGFPNGAVTYDGIQNQIPRSTPKHAGDLAPAGIGSQGADLQVTDLKLSRDVYYIAGAGNPLRNFGHSGQTMSDYPTSGNMPLSYVDRVANQSLEAVDDVFTKYEQRREAFLSSPEAWPEGFSEMMRVRFVLEAFPESPERDQFFAAGDNSPASSDSRLWNNERFFERELLIGKAVFIYWPHSLDKPFPFFPNFGKMGFVH